MFYKDRDEELVYRREDASIMARYRACVVQMAKRKQNGEKEVPKWLFDALDVPGTICEYSAEQWERVQEYKDELKRIAEAFGYTKEDDFAVYSE